MTKAAMHALPHAGVCLSGEGNLDTLTEPNWRSDYPLRSSLRGPSVASSMGGLWREQFATKQGRQCFIG